ncbi:hypothetical protein GLYMA_01G138400v4 [Glycine max]|uniref:Reverse transcriptase zinc-binding domain-containing protein n=1 Tax=Glycine max TaxID=3847 RepID=A0A0R0LFT3_SOYBN|nr:uncharacterized protein LOC114405357 [Glycine soja]KAG5069378.1 hypothetical protein JHK85_001755 [Glycine max]KAG5060672.1 hypothetical protein JHK87_001701 [Glycine soja]KAG5089102.1 hypothetical protein JHK86_001714 [Glycine max]KAH1162997.1 hypothetical protein GYH30_001500 [Glycine max]KRH76194.1 hypothetical protein GLYMA_01G138400v4 [Glycine max]|eukprot:XP_006573421.1 uncharacterized protein LOC102663182 [Glycine max]
MFGNSLQKECKIPQMGVWDGDTWIWNLAWRHNWFLWDHDLVATFMELIDNKKSIINKKDNWVWMNNSEGTYCVKHMYKSLLSQEGETEQHIDSKVWSTLWNIKASSKALAFSWSLLLNKIQSKGIGKTKSNQIWKVVWVLWRHQNNIIFREGNPDF